jgi:hypothetical protein
MALWLLLFALLAPTPALAVVAAGHAEKNAVPGTQELSDDDLLILEVRLDRFVLADAIVGYMRGGDVLLPLGELAQALDFPILVEAYDGRAQGWFIRETKGFHLELSQGEVVIEGVKAKFDTNLVARDLTEVYVESSLLSRWFAIGFDVDLPRMLVRVHPSEPLPIQRWMEREERHKKLLARRSARKVLPRRDAAYRMASWPSVDFELHQRLEDEGMSLTYNLLSTADLAKMSTELYAAGDRSDSLSSLRLRAFRTDLEGGLFGPLRATSFQIGDVFTPSIALVSQGRKGRGLMISNGPLLPPDEFASTSIRGDAPAGWDVELYRNGTLLDFLTSDDSGRFEFSDVPIELGQNIMRTVSYGPQGQIREQVDRYQIGDSMIRPGELRYRLFAVRPDGFLADGWLKDGDSAAEEPSSWDIHTRIDYGIDRRVSLGTRFTRTTLGGRPRSYAGLVFRTSVLGIFAEAETTRDLDGGTAFQLSTQASFEGISLVGRHGFFDNYTSDEDNGRGARSRETQIRINGSLTPPGLRPVAYNLKFERLRFNESAIQSETRTSLRLASSVRRVSLMHELESEPRLSHA